MNLKTICAMAVLVAPIAYCTAVDNAKRLSLYATLAETCIKSGRVWTHSWGGYCYPEGDNP